MTHSLSVLCWPPLLLPVAVETVLVQVDPLLPALVLDLGLGLGLVLGLALVLGLGLDLGLDLDLGLVLAPFVLDATGSPWHINYGINETLSKCYIYFIFDPFWFCSFAPSPFCI